MNALQCLDLVRRLAPKSRLGSLAPGRWEAGLDSRDPFGVLSLRRFADESEFCAEEFLWDLGAGRAVETYRWKDQSSGVDGAGRRLARIPAPASGVPFKEFTALWPAKDIVSEWEIRDGRRLPRPGWSLRLARPVPWPRFIATNMADPFAGAAAPLACLLLDRKVTELRFSEESLRAYVRA